MERKLIIRCTVCVKGIIDYTETENFLKES